MSNDPLETKTAVANVPENPPEEAYPAGLRFVYM